MRSQKILTTMAVLLAASVASQAATFDQLVGAVTPGGDAYLIKRFSVTSGSVVAGVEFYSNDLRTTFPEVAILRGPASKLSEAPALVQLTNVRPVGQHRTVATCAPLRITSDQELYVAIRLPVSDGIRRLGDGAGIAARRHTGLPTSYFAMGRDGAFGAMDVDYGIALVFESAGKVMGSEDDPTPALRTFLRANSPVSAGGTTNVEFGLEWPGTVSVVVYDVAGRRIRTLAHETLPAGRHVRGWDGRDDEGGIVAAGIYFVKLEAGEKVLTEKLLRIR